MRSLQIPIVLAFALSATACGHDESVGPRTDSNVGFDEAAQQELVDAGVGKYFGLFTPSKVDQYETYDAYTFEADDDGPVCLYGSNYRMAVRDVGSKDLMIFLQGGGACWSKLCLANTSAGTSIVPIGWTDADPERNPALASFNLAFVSYCDGSVFSGDNLVKNPDGTILRRHRGLANLSAALDVAKTRFPHPRRIVLAGSSAGGYGTILGTAVVRLAYPHVPLAVIDDAGIGLTNPDDPSIIEAAKNEWRVGELVPPSCTGCLESGQFTSVVGWGLSHDPSIKVSAFSSYEDSIISGTFLDMQPENFQALLLKETDKLHSQFPDRYKRFFVDGSSHTAILAGYYSLEIQGTTLLDWTSAMLDDESAWQDLLE